MKRTLIDDEDYKVEFDDTPELRDKVFEKVLQFFKDHDSYIGECIMQNDDPIINAPNYFAEIADDIIKFEVNYKED